MGIYNISIKLNIKLSIVRDILCGVYFSEATINNNIYTCLGWKISDDAVHYICKLLSDGEYISDISALTGVTKYQISDILNRRSYLEISKHYNFTNAKYSYKKAIDPKVVEEVCRRLKMGEYPGEIAKDLNIGTSTINDIKSKNKFIEISNKFGDFERINRERLDDQIVHSICLDLQNGFHNTDIMKKYNLYNSTISRIRSGELYPQISSQYNIPESKDLEKLRQYTDDQVHEVCKLLAEGRTPTEVSQITNVALQRVNGIKSGTCYRDISSQYSFPKLTNVITDDQIKTICIGLQEGWRLKDIIEKANVSKYTIYRIRNRKTHTEISKDYIW